jgi:hypothetical protein
MVVMLGLMLQRFPSRSKLVVTGPLTPKDVQEIEHFISRERAALIGGYPMNKAPGMPRSNVTRRTEFFRANSTK